MQCGEFSPCNFSPASSTKKRQSPKLTRRLLRLAILGLTYQLTNSQVDLSTYEIHQTILATEVARLSTTPDSLQIGNVSTALATSTSTSERDRSIRPSEELRFCLFRHWNLYDAMFHSGYLGVKMKLWTMEGRKKLSGLLAKMG
jgi:cell division control protein 45